MEPSTSWARRASVDFRMFLRQKVRKMNFVTLHRNRKWRILEFMQESCVN